MSVTHTKTGAKRYRVEPRWFRTPLVVLQVEVHAEGYEVTDSYGGGMDVNHCYWRDAQVQDITEEKPNDPRPNKRL
jgi:hypothetical protein